MLAEASLDDLPAAADLLSGVYPDGLFTAAGLRHRLAARPAWTRPLLLKWEEDGGLAAWSWCALDHFSGDRGLGILNVTVRASARGRGIGGALLARALEHLGECGADRADAFGWDAEAPRTFMAARGFAVKARLRISSLDPRTLGPAPPPPSGVDVRPFAAFEDDPAAIHRVDLAVSRDIPNEESIDGLDAEAWTAEFWRDPELDKELSLAAVAGGGIVGITMLRTDPERGRGANDITGVLPAYRGRGLATLLKHTSLRRAADRGIAIVGTGNDEENAAMLAVNARLGYRPSSGRIRWTRAL